jgi:hypothetical protein
MQLDLGRNDLSPLGDSRTRQNPEKQFHSTGYWQKRKLLLIIHESSFPPKQQPMPLLWEVNEETATQPSDARPSPSAAIVAAVTRNPWNRSPTCDAFRRIDRSDASSSALSSFRLKLERHI